MDNKIKVAYLEYKGYTCDLLTKIQGGKYRGYISTPDGFNSYFDVYVNEVDLEDCFKDAVDALMAYELAEQF